VLDHPPARLGGVDPHSLGERSQPSKASSLATAHAAGQERDGHGLDVSHCGNQGEDADKQAEQTDVRGDPDAGPSTPKRAVDDSCRSERTEEAADTTGDRLRRAADRETDDSADRDPYDRADPNAEHVRAKDPDEHDAEPEAETQT